MNILKRLADEGQRAAAPPVQRNPELDSKGYQNGTHNSSTSDSSSSVTTSERGVEYTSPLAQ